MTQHVYNATETAAAFHASDAFVRLLFGPVGTGKSVACCHEVIVRAFQQEPGSDGIRRSRWAVVRNTYPELKSTTIKTWQEWVIPEVYGSPTYSSPICHKIRITESQFGKIECDVFFISLDSDADVQKLMSLELTGIYINELQFISKNLFTNAITRLNRYPPAKFGAPITWTGLIADTNPPDTEHWIYKHFEQTQHNKTDLEMFKFLPAVIKVDETQQQIPYNSKRSASGTLYTTNPSADYVRCPNDKSYWIKLVPSLTDEQIKVYLQGEYGVFIDGRPVHTEYNDVIHFSKTPISYNSAVELGLGWDFGLTPACAIVQYLPGGQLAVLAELYNDSQSLRDFAEYTVIPFLNTNYPGWDKNYVSRHDPAGQTASQTDGKSCQEILKSLGIVSWPAADNNAPTARRDGLKFFLRRLTGGQPGFLLNNQIVRIRKGLIGSYHYQRIKSATHEAFNDKPAKNLYSHICEALEYIAMYYAQPVNQDSADSKNAITELLQYNRHQGIWSY